MSKVKEKISCLIDNEAQDTAAILTALKTVDASGQAWQRYHLIGEVLRDNTHDYLLRDISKQVMSQLEHEPTVLSPSLLSQRLSAFIKPAVGFAVAATVAAVTVVSLQLYRQTETTGTYEVVAIANPQPFIATPVSFGDKHLDQSGKTAWQTSESEAQEQLNDYLMVHAEYASTGNIQGMLPYVRLAGFDKNP